WTEIDQNIQKKMAMQMRPMVQNRVWAKTAKIPMGESSAEIVMSVLRVRLGLQPARCRRSVRYPPAKLAMSATTKGMATINIPESLMPRSFARKLGIQKT